MFEAKANPLKNRLYITIGRVRRDKVTETSKSVEAAVAKLEPGFTCVTRVVDHREFEIPDLEQVKAVQEYLKAHGLAKVVRVGVQTGTEFVDEIGQITGYTADVASSLEDAEKMLDKWEMDNQV